MSVDMINVIFGMKVRQARQEAGLSLKEFASQAKLSASYVTEIEKGRKYPRANKIIKMAKVLGKRYDDLVSITLDSSLAHLGEALESPLLQHFPFNEFDLDVSDFIELLTRSPDKASALLHAFLEIGRQYDIQESDFWRAALRSHQQIYENYFPDLEDAAVEFARRYDLDLSKPVTLATLEDLIQSEFGFTLDHATLIADEALAGYRSVFIDGTPPRLLLNARLSDNRVKFLLTREMGYRYLDLNERSFTSTPDRAESFQQVLNDFKASYFAGALLMPREPVIADVQRFFDLPQWSPQYLLDMLDKYDVTSEMLLYRFSELIPEFFGLRLHFLRFHRINGHYKLIKQLNMNNLIMPSGGALNEHHCRRWLSVRLLRHMAAQHATSDQPPKTRHIGVQMSEFLESHERFFCLGFANPLSLLPDVSSSVIVGFQVDADFKRTVRFANDPAISTVTISETCERCPLLADQCHVRAVEPVVLRARQHRRTRTAALNRLLGQMRGE